MPPNWQAAHEHLVEASRTPSQGPPWWTSDRTFYGQVESRAAGSHYCWDGIQRFKKGDRPFFFFQYTLGGWGIFEAPGEGARQILPGMGFLAVVPSRHRYFLPEDSPGWTFAWVNFHWPYLMERVAQQIPLTGHVVQLEPTSALAKSALRITSGSYRKDFADRLDVELALFQFVIAYERLAQEQTFPFDERDRLLEAVRRRVLLNPRQALNIDELASEYGMTRSHFSHFFRARTGLTPARFITETRVREAASMLLSGSIPIKQIADECGFANTDHFSRVFRRFRHVSPGAYRKGTY